MPTLLTDQARRGAQTGSPALARIRAYVDTLGPSERAVARAVLAHPETVPDWSTQQLARTAGTSTATVIRACQSLGFRGYQHLRLELAREGHATHERPEPPGDTVDRVFERAQAALLVGRDAIDRTALDRAVVLLANARRVVCTANGFSAPPLQDAAMRLATIGRPVEAPLDILAQQFAAHTLGPGDICLALSHSGANTHTLATARAARDRGAHVIALCSYARAPLPDLADVTISTGATGPQHTVDPFFIRLGHSVLLQALLTELSDALGQADALASTDTLGMREVVAGALTDSAR